MASAFVGDVDSGLPDLNAIDELDNLWKQASGCNNRTSTTTTESHHTSASNQAGCTDSTMTDLNQPVTGISAGASPLTQATDYEATPDLELSIKIVYADQSVKHLEGSLNPIKPVGQLKTRLAQRLHLLPNLVEMSWSKKLNNGHQANPVVLEDSSTLMDYEVETDDTIILRELLENN